MTTEASAFWYRKSGGQERTGESVWENGQSLASEPEIGEARGEDATDPRELAGKPQRAGDASRRAERVAGPRLRRRARGVHAALWTVPETTVNGGAARWGGGESVCSLTSLLYCLSLSPPRASILIT